MVTFSLELKHNERSVRSPCQNWVEKTGGGGGGGGGGGARILTTCGPLFFTTVNLERFGQAYDSVAYTSIKLYDLEN